MPVASLTSPANNVTFTAPASVRLTANASDTDGTISEVAFYNGNTLITAEQLAPYEWTWSNVATGTYTITAKATDNQGAVTTSAARIIAVNNSGSNTFLINEPFTSATAPFVTSGGTWTVAGQQYILSGA